MAVTQRKDEEQLSSSMFNTAIIGDPIANFSSFITPNESIRNRDVVLWITSGLMHYPGSEDAPVTPTTGSTMGFVLRPFNFFDINAAIELADVVYVPGKVDNATAKAIAGKNASSDSINIVDIASAYQPFSAGKPVEEQCLPSYAGAVQFIPGYDPSEATIDFLLEMEHGLGGVPSAPGAAAAAAAPNTTDGNVTAANGDGAPGSLAG